MQFLLHLPIAFSFLIVSALTSAVALAGLHLVRRKYSAEVLKENHEVGAIIFNAFGLFYGVMVAFVVFVTWTGYDDATKNLQMEASERSEEHTSELQSHSDLVCRLLLEKKKNNVRKSRI